MFEVFLSRTYYGNTVFQWLVALGIVLASLIIGRALYWLTGNVIKKLTAKTESRLDDLIVDMVEEPAVLVVTLVGVWMGISRLSLPPAAHAWLGQALRFVVILTAAWLVTRLLDAIHKEYLVPLAEKTQITILVPLRTMGRSWSSRSDWVFSASGTRYSLWMASRSRVTSQAAVRITTKRSA